MRGGTLGLGETIMLWKHLAAHSSVLLLAACQQPQPVAAPGTATAYRLRNLASCGVPNVVQMLL